MEQIISRAKNILFEPKKEWEIIKSEETSAKDVVIKYVLILALIPAIASFIGYGLIGVRMPFIGHVATVSLGLKYVISHYLSTVIGIIVSAWVIQLLATSFSATVNLDSAIKLVAYSYTASMVAGILYILPALSILVIAGSIYSLVILYQGFKPMTNVPEEKTTSYFIVSLLVTVVVSIVVSVILGVILTAFGLGIHI